MATKQQPACKIRQRREYSQGTYRRKMREHPAQAVNSRDRVGGRTRPNSQYNVIWRTTTVCIPHAIAPYRTVSNS